MNGRLVCLNLGMFGQARRLITAADIASDYIVGGEKVQLVGLTKQMRIMRRSATVTHPCSSTSLSAASVPRFRAVHEEVNHKRLPCFPAPASVLSPAICSVLAHAAQTMYCQCGTHSDLQGYVQTYSSSSCRVGDACSGRWAVVMHVTGATPAVWCLAKGERQASLQ